MSRTNCVQKTRLYALAAAGFMATAGLQACAGAGVSKQTGGSSSSSSQGASGADQQPIRSSNGEEGIPVNHLCSCKDLVDAPARGGFPVVLNETIKQQANCVFFDGSNKDHYLSMTVYAGARPEDLDGAVRRARKGYETVSETRSETTGDGLSARWFSGAGTKSHVVGSLVQNASSGLIVEAREIRLGNEELPLTDHVSSAAARAGALAASACKKP